MAASATLHCLTGCAIGEITGMVIGAGVGLGNAATVPLSFGLAFVFGYSLSTLPVVRAGVAFLAALTTVLAADTLSILTMEVVDNGVVLAIPGALEAGLGNPLFWVSMAISLTAAFAAAFPVNKWLMARGKGHAKTHEYMHGGHEPEGWRRWVPDPAPTTLAAVIAAFLVGGLLASLAG
ncbi:MAG: hypothetical protein CMH83_22875 [Nocardioides sp.]|nr:hypothetical protein [Nocardioides sp.]